MELKRAKKIKKKIAMLRVLQEYCFWPAAESAHNSQNAQFGLKMKFLDQLNRVDKKAI